MTVRWDAGRRSKYSTRGARKGATDDGVAVRSLLAIIEKASSCCPSKSQVKTVCSSPTTVQGCLECVTIIRSSLAWLAEAFQPPLGLPLKCRWTWPEFCGETACKNVANSIISLTHLHSCSIQIASSSSEGRLAWHGLRYSCSKPSCCVAEQRAIPVLTRCPAVFSNQTAAESARLVNHRLCFDA